MTRVGYLAEHGKHGNTVAGMDLPEKIRPSIEDAREVRKRLVFDMTKEKEINRKVTCRAPHIRGIRELEHRIHLARLVHCPGVRQQGDRKARRHPPLSERRHE